ncbi:MAG: PAS domain-containing protein [Opitutales bacterium]
MTMKQNYDTIPVPISVRRTDGRYTYVNRAWSEMFSVKQENALGHTDFDLSLDPLALPEGEPGSIAGEYAFRDVYITTREKGRLLLELIETRVEDEEDEEGIMCVHQDMTGIGWRMEDITRNLSRSEYNARQNMQQLVRLSRDMCEPLEQMVLYCDKLSQSQMDGEQRDWLSLVRDNARLLQKHIRRSIDLSVLDDGLDESGEEPATIAPILNEVRELYSGIARDKGISIETHVGIQLETPVVVDASKVRQIMVNLLDSAVRSAKSGRISMCASMIPGSDRPLCLKVRVENPRELPPGENQGDNSFLRISMGLSHRIVRGLCGVLGGRFEICTEADGSRILRVYLRAGSAAPPRTRK